MGHCGGLRERAGSGERVKDEWTLMLLNKDVLLDTHTDYYTNIYDYTTLYYNATAEY